MTDANKEPQAAPGEILQEPTPEKVLQQQPGGAAGGGLADMTAGEFMDKYKDMTPEEQAQLLLENYKNLTPEEQAQIKAQTAEMLAGFAEANREALEGITKAAKGIFAIMASQANPISDALARAAKRISDALEAAREAREEFIKSEEWPKLQAIFPGITEGQGTFISFMAADLIEYGPEIREILEEYEAEEGRPLTFEELLERPAPDDPNPDDPKIVLLEAILYRAQQIREERRGKLPKATAHPPAKIGYMLDKVNGAIWSFLEQDTSGQLTFAMEAKRGRSKKPLDLIYSIDFSAAEEEGAKVSKRLTQTDKRVYIAISNLFEAGNNVITLSQIHKEMGNTRRPSDDQIQRINDSVYKMARAWITIDDAAEHKAYSYDIDEHRPDKRGWTGGRYDGSLLPLERGQAFVKGQLIDGALHLLREPPLYTFAKLRKQITSFDRKLLQSPISKTEGNLLIEDYLLTRIARAKKSQKEEKILFSTLYKQTNMGDRKQRQRAPGKIETYLKYYQGQGFIKSYLMGADSVTIYF